MKSHITSFLIAYSLVFTGIGSSFHVQAQAGPSAASTLSAMPIASVVGASAGAVVAVPVALSVSGAVLLVKGVELSARGTVLLLERASDGARASVEISGQLARGTSLAVGTVVAVSVVQAGVILSVAGSVIAFIPNEIGRALLHNERLTH